MSQKQVGGKVGKPKTSNPAFPISTRSLFKWRHFLPEVLLLNVRWYCRYALSYRDLEEMMRERGIEVDHSTINRWVLKYAPELDKRMRPYFKPPALAVGSIPNSEFRFRIGLTWSWVLKESQVFSSPWQPEQRFYKTRPIGFGLSTRPSTLPG